MRIGTAAVLALPAAAQTTKLISTGDVLPGLGTVTHVLEFEANEAGDWIAAVRTDQMRLAWHNAFVLNGAVVLKPGDIVAGAPFAGSFESGVPVALDSQGNYAWKTAIPVGLKGMWISGSPCLLQGQPIVGADVEPGTVSGGAYNLVFEPGGSALVNAAMFGTSSGLFSRAIVRTGPQGSGSVATSTLKEGDSLPGHGSVVSYIADGAHSMASNAAGDVMYAVRFLDGVEGIYRGSVPLALTGQPSPVLGVNWGGVAPLLHGPVELNDAGDYAFTGLLDAPVGASELLVRNGIAVARQGDVLPAIAPHAITKLGGTHGFGAPVRLTQDGRVLWLATWSDPDTTRDSGLFLDQQLVVQEGVTQVGGVPIDEFSLINGSRDFDISADGKSIHVRALLANGQVGLISFQLEGSTQSIPGCVPNAGVLSAAAAPQVGEQYAVIMDGAQSASALSFLFVSTQPATESSLCGLPLPGIGEVLINVAAPNLVAVLNGVPLGQPPAATSVVRFGKLPNLLLLFGKTFYAQGLWLDAAGANPAEPLRLTNALALSIGI
jgi:hypothetical protein